MRAVVLVGGFGTRLRPLTNTVPKPMLPVGHEPMIAHLIGGLALGGVTEVILALGFNPEPFIQGFPDGTCGDVTLRYAVEPEPLDTGGAIRFAAERAGLDDTFVVVNGDVITDLDVSHLVAEHRRFGAEATLHLIRVEDPSAFGVVDLNSDGRIRSFVEKPSPGTEPSNLVNAGTYVFEPSVLARISPGDRVSVERETFPAIADDGGLFGVATDDYWIDAGRPDLYRAANLDLLDGRRGARCEPVASTAEVALDAVVERSIVGAGAIVASRASVETSVILPGAVVGAGAKVSDSLVMGQVGANASVARSMIGAAGTVPDGSAIEDAAVPPVE
jgi:mannose-1-phosphate guanylyltransferase